jgi:hypothetical protein
MRDVPFGSETPLDNSRLVQPGLPPVVPSEIFPRLDRFQALGIKRYTLGR